MLVGTLFLVAASCDETSTPSGPSESDRAQAPSETTNPGEASLLLEDLNDRLSPSHRCDDDAPYLAASYAERIRNRDTAACRFSDGSPLVIYSVRDGQRTYERHFRGQRGPFYYLYCPTWIAIAYLLTPCDALDVLREDLGATG